MGRWRELIASLCPNCEFGDPATEAALREVEEALGVAVPEDLAALWREANGVTDEGGTGIWSAEEAVRQNLEQRAYPEMNDLYMSFDPLFCFADEGNGDLYFFPIQAGGVNRPDVFAWDHESDSRAWRHNNLQQFVEQWLSGGSAG